MSELKHLAGCLGWMLFWLFVAAPLTALLIRWGEFTLAAYGFLWRLVAAWITGGGV